TLFANVSHELRTPLALILGPLDRMLAAPDTEPALRRDLEIMRRNARSLLGRVNDLLDVARLEAGKMTLVYARVELGALVRVTCSNFETLAESRAITFAIETPSPCFHEVDLERVQRVLVNLLSNALTFTPAGGHVRCTLIRRPDAAVL